MSAGYCAEIRSQYDQIVMSHVNMNVRHALFLYAFDKHYMLEPKIKLELNQIELNQLLRCDDLTQIYHILMQQ